MRFLICLAKKARAKARRSFWSPETKNTERRKACPCWPKSFPKARFSLPRFFLLGIRPESISIQTTRRAFAEWNHLKSADLMLTGTRFRRPHGGGCQTRHRISQCRQAGDRNPYCDSCFYRRGLLWRKDIHGAFGPLVMGEGWVSHHGRHKVEGSPRSH